MWERGTRGAGQELPSGKRRGSVASGEDKVPSLDQKLCDTSTRTTIDMISVGELEAREVECNYSYPA